MNKSLEQLIKLSNFDVTINSFGPQIDAQNAKLAEFMAIANKLQAQVDERVETINEAESKKTKNNIHLDELRSKLADVASKMDNVSNAKELKALQLEEEIAKEQVSFTNEEISRLDNVIELKESELVDLKEKLTEELETVEALEDTISKEIASINEKRAEISTQRDAMIGTVDSKLLASYEKIKRWAKDTAVVPMKKQACYGCFMKVSDKTYSAVIKAEDIVPCPHCGRVLFNDTQAED